VLHTRVVDEDIDRSFGLLEAIDGRFGSRVVANIEGQDFGARDLSGGVSKFSRIAAIQYDCGPGFSQTLG
jgi:hypothetical protein